MQPVEHSDPDGIDHGWVMQMTFVATILVGSPITAILSVSAGLQTWGVHIEFVIRIDAAIWFVIAVVLFVYAKRVNAGDGGMPPGAELDTDIDAED